MNSKCENCNLYFSGYCFCEDEPEKITGEILRCDYYLATSQDNSFRYGFISGFTYCNTMKKQPVIKKIEDRAKTETIKSIIDIIRFDRNLSGDNKDKLTESIKEIMKYDNG